jgi:hypothetical protein
LGFRADFSIARDSTGPAFAEGREGRAAERPAVGARRLEADMFRGLARRHFRLSDEIGPRSTGERSANSPR